MDGEWKGSKPCKFPSSKRIIGLQSNTQGRASHMSSTSKLEFSYKQKKHFHSERSSTKVWRPCIKISVPTTRKTPEKITDFPIDKKQTRWVLRKSHSRANQRSLAKSRIKEDRAEVKKLDNWETNILKSLTMRQKYQQFREKRFGTSMGSDYLISPLM